MLQLRAVHSTGIRFIHVVQDIRGDLLKDLERLSQGDSAALIVEVALSRLLERELEMADAFHRVEQLRRARESQQ